MVVPAKSVVAVATPSLRDRRLVADEAMVRTLTGNHSSIALVSAVGSPPHTYRIKYDVLSLRDAGDEPADTTDHLVLITLGNDYPRAAPMCQMMSEVFHPNIDTSTICVGDHWTPGEKLSDLIVRIAEMLAYQSYNIRSPLNAKAAMWADLNPSRLPTDKRSFV